MDHGIDASDAISLILGVFLGAWYNQFLKRPKLLCTGGGSGGAGAGQNDLVVQYVVVWNAPGLLGFNIGPTTLFGWRIFSGSSIGLSVDRSTARNCSARLLDRDTNEYLADLLWRVDNQIKRSIDLGPAERAELLIVARKQEHPSSYFALAGHNDDGLLPPPANAWLTETRKFLVEISHSYGRTARFKVEVVKRMDGKFQFRSPIGGGTL